MAPAAVEPEPVPTGPVRRLIADWRAERSASAPFPPGDLTPSLRRTRRLVADPLNLLLEAYARHGPVFTLRIFHARHVFAIGPEANQYMLVTHAGNFRCRDGSASVLIPLLGDGLLTTDGAVHDRARGLMLPAFQHARVAATHAIVRDETERALSVWAPGARVDVYAWARDLSMRIATRALCGFGSRSVADPAAEFMNTFGYICRAHTLQFLRGPGTPYARMMAARRRLDALVLDEIARRRTTGERRDDVLSMLLDATIDDGTQMTDRHVRDQIVTLLFAAHITTAPAIAFLFHELARHRAWADRVAAELSARELTADELTRGADSQLDLALLETLRLYPPAWLGPRRSVETFTLAGMTVPGGALVNYSPWATHRLPDVWEEPNAFRPERFAQANRARLPRGAYVPFGGGSRTCLGKRFAELQIRTIAARALREFRLSTVPGFRLEPAVLPALGPKGGMPMVVHAARGS
jgi:cytochrome P450